MVIVIDKCTHSLVVKIGARDRAVHLWLEMLTIVKQSDKFQIIPLKSDHGILHLLKCSDKGFKANEHLTQGGGKLVSQHHLGIIAMS